jgi:hypothetical protein
MKKRIIFLVCLLIAVISLSAQQKVNVQNGTKTEFYNSLDTAIQKAVAGDTIYLPGGVILAQPDLVIDKKLAIIGVGWDMTSIGGVSVTDSRRVDSPGGNNTITFNEGSDGSLLTGCVVGDVLFGDNIKNITILRNRIGNIGISGSGNITQIVISENVTGNIYGSTINSTDCEINNNLCSSIGFFNHSHIYNNVVTYYFRFLTNCTVENNFCMNGLGDGSSYSYFNNNAFGQDFTFPVETNIGNNNLMNQATATTFKVDDLNSPNNLEIQDSSPCKGAGTDGTDIGIYGGTNPYKKGGLPFNPHITKVVIPGQVDRNGNIRVDIAVEAQNR